MCPLNAVDSRIIATGINMCNNGVKKPAKFARVSKETLNSYTAFMFNSQFSNTFLKKLIFKGLGQHWANSLLGEKNAVS